MGKVLQISIYSIVLILIFLLFGSMLKSCGNSAADSITDTATEVTDNIKKAGGEVVAKAESIIDDGEEEFEGDDIDFSTDNGETKSYSNSSEDNENTDDDNSPSYVQDDAPSYNPPEDVVQTEKVEPSNAVPKETKSTSASGSSTGNYLLITGNYSQESNANAMVSRLKNMGFPNAQSVIFENSRYYTVIAGKYSSMNSANAAKADLRDIDSYVQKKRL